MSKLLTEQCVCLHGGALPNRNLGTRARALGTVALAVSSPLRGGSTCPGGGIPQAASSGGP